MNKDKNWNLGAGLPNVCESVMRKLNGAGWRLENGPRTILNVDSYEVTAPLIVTIIVYAAIIQCVIVLMRRAIRSRWMAEGH